MSAATEKVSRNQAAELLLCELSLLAPSVRRDRKRVSALLSKDFFEVGASGRVWTRDEILELLATETFQAPVMENFVCRKIEAGVMLVTYRTMRIHPETGERLLSLRSSIWCRQARGWLLRFHQGTSAR